MKIDLQNFRQPIVNEQDKHLNYDDGLNINYNRIPLFYDSERFSGTTIEEGEDYIRLIEYEDGLMEGKNALYWDELLVSEVFYAGSYEIKGKTWHESGVLESIWDRLCAKSWASNGQLVYEKNTETEDVEERWYFADGKLKFRQFTNLHICTQEYFAPDGEWLLTHKFLYDYSPIRDEAVYNDEALFKWYFEVLNYETTEGGDEYNSEAQQHLHLIWAWFWEVRAKNKTKFIEIFAKLILHPQPKVVQDAVNIITYHRYNEDLKNYYLAQNQSISEKPLAEIFAKIETEQNQLDKISPKRITHKD